MSNANTDTNTLLIDQLALQTRLLRAIQADMGEIRLQYTQTKSCESFERQNISKAIESVASSTRILSDLIMEYRDLHTYKNKKFIAVARGRNPGIYTDINTAQDQVHEYPGKMLAAFDSYPEAQKYMLHAKYEIELETKKLEDFEEGKLTNEFERINI